MTPKEKKPVRTGIIGCGVIGRFHLKEAIASPLLEVVAVADVNKASAREAAQSVGIETVYSSAEALFADERVEAVVLALPACFRTELALAALAAGKHVLLEKPVAMNAAEVRSLMDARGDRVVACCSARFSLLNVAEKAREVVASGALGELRSVQCRVIGPAGPPPSEPPPAWRLKKEMNGGGILVNWGSYDLDFMMSVTGWKLEPETVLARSWTISPVLEEYVAPDSNAETHVSAAISCTSGTMIRYDRAEISCAAAESAWGIIGDKASLRIQMAPHQTIPAVILDEMTLQGVVSKTLLEQDDTFAEQHGRILDDFAGAIRSGHEPSTNLERSLVLQRITDAVYASAENGSAVVL